MSHLDAERLSLIAIGETATVDERTHLEGCDECALELAELEYTVAVGRSTVELGGIEAPPERVWGRIADELHLGTAGEPEPVAPVVTSVAPAAAEAAPVVTSVAPAAAEAAPVVAASGVAPAKPKPHRRGVRVLFALAASVAVILAGVFTWSLTRPPQPVEVAAATLEAFPDHPGALGEAVVVENSDGERQVKVALDASDGDDGYREVWLITTDASALVSLGVLEGSEGVFDIPEDIDLRDYRLVDISQEPEDGDPTHSGDSIVRGELGFA
ncbi:anti-sigma factor [Microbacterium sp. CFBP9034]|uniref:anti-sigma factor n=1 Tax=Microbacterium sp. CFBP9034 TaxID=3096540 RepID=UPI002A6AEB35|nr:anti-sigma factor [Microbacterium sp. CFBP9034]MDY0909376.1 anti-sigma factor [Microbacterium sp. CFBP9034]